MSTTEIEALDALTTAVTSLSSVVNDVFSFPPSDQFAAVFSFAVVLPVVAYKVSWVVGKLLGMFR